MAISPGDRCIVQNYTPPVTRMTLRHPRTFNGMAVRVLRIKGPFYVCEPESKTIEPRQLFFRADELRRAK